MAIRVSRSNLRDVTNRGQDEEATVEIASLTRTGPTMTYSEVDKRKAEAVQEAMAIADSLLERAESAERDVAQLKRMRDEDTLLKEQELKNMQLLVNRLEEEKRALIKGVDEEVSNAKRKIYEKFRLIQLKMKSFESKI